jgi:transposase InsO family protein
MSGSSRRDHRSRHRGEQPGRRGTEHRARRRRGGGGRSTARGGRTAGTEHRAQTAGAGTPRPAADERETTALPEPAAARQLLETTLRELRAVFKRVTERAEAERASVAAVLHDNVIKRLDVLAAQLDPNDAAERGGADPSAALRDRLSEARRQAVGLAESVWMLLSRLRPPLLDERGLLAALRAYGERCARSTSVSVVKPETILEWFRRLVAKKFDSSKSPRKPGGTRTPEEIEELIVKMARENSSWGYSRIVGALSNLGIKRCEETIAEILRRHGVPPSSQRQPTVPWSKFIRTHQDVLAAADFFTAEVLTAVGVVTYYVLFFMHLDSRRVLIAGITQDPHEGWMKQVARNLTMAGLGFLEGRRYVIIDRDSKYTASFRAILKSAGLKVIRLPPYSPDLNAFCERWVLSVKSELLERLVVFGEEGLRRALSEYVEHYHEERNHHGLAT